LCGSTSNRRLTALRLREFVDFKDYADLKTAAGTHSNLLAVAQVVNCDLEAVAAGAWVVVDLENRIEDHVLAMAL
jgi:hypothetical protein